MNNEFLILNIREYLKQGKDGFPAESKMFSSYHIEKEGVLFLQK